MAHDRATAAAVRAALCCTGWRIDTAAGAAQAVRAVSRRRYAFVLVEAGAGALAIVGALRDRSADRFVPILLLGPGGDGLAQLDGQVAIAAAAPLAEQLAPWGREAADPARARLAAAFGTAVVADLVARFLVQLEDALAHVAAPDAQDRAHRIAGLAGTLGFGEVHAAWLALSEGETGAAGRAASAARRALRAAR